MTDKPTLSGFLVRVQDLLAINKPQEALEVIAKSRLESPAAKNARAVCLLRMDQVQPATAILRELLFPRDSISPSPDVPAIFYTNYVTAMLMQGNLTAATGILAQVPDKKHPAVLRLRETLQQWRGTLGIGWRMLSFLGFYPERPVDLEFPPGDIV